MIILILLTALTADNNGTKMLNLINAERGRRGLLTLRVSMQLNAAAQQHNSYQLKRGACTHKGPRGSWPWSRAARFGFGDGSVATVNENVGGSRGHVTATEYHKGFMSSPGHRTNLLNPIWDSVGINYIRGENGTYMCILFGRSRAPHAKVTKWW